MARLKYLIIKSKNHGELVGTTRYADSHEEECHEMPGSEYGYKEYLLKYGPHFNDKLSQWASRKQINAYGEKNHHWTVEEVRAAYERMGYAKPEEITWGDVAYSANMHYSDYFGLTLKTEADCIKQAFADVNDPDGYTSKIFDRWCADVQGKQVNVPWDDFI